MNEKQMERGIVMVYSQFWKGNSKINWRKSSRTRTGSIAFISEASRQGSTSVKDENGKFRFFVRSKVTQKVEKWVYSRSSCDSERKEKVQGCVSHNSAPKKSILRKAGRTRLNASVGHAIKFTGRTWYEVRIRERKGPSRGFIQKGEPHERNPSAPKNTWGNLTTRRVRPQSSMELGEKNVQSQGRGQSYVLFSCENKGTGASVHKRRRTYVCGWFGSFNAHAEQAGWKLRWNGHLTEVQKPYDGSWPQMEKCKQTRRHKCMFTISICSSLCNYSKKRQQFYRLVSFAQNTDVHTSGKTVKLHDWPQNGKTIACIMDNFVPLVVPGLSSSSSSSSASTSRPKDQSQSNGESEALTDPMTTWRAKRACGKPMQTNPDMQTSGSRGLAHTENEMDEEDPTQGIPDWFQPFTENLEDLEDACARTSVWKRDLRFGRWCFKSGDTKTEAQYL